MKDGFDIYTILFLALAVFIFFRLRSVLGQKTGSERPPQERRNVPSGDDKIVRLPTRRDSPASTPAPDAGEVPPVEGWKGIAEPDTPLEAGLNAIRAADPGFDANHFVAGARQAYEMIVGAFAEGDRKTLKGLLAKEVFDGFDAAIKEREQRGEAVETRFVSIDSAQVTSAEQRGSTAQITLRFISKLFTSTVDKSGKLIDGSPDRVSEVTDVWTFARDVKSRDPNWKLVATEAVSQ